MHDAVLAHLVSARSGRPRAREPTGATLTVTLVGFGAVTDRPCARNGLLGEVDSLDYLQFVEVLSGPAGVRLDEDDRLIASRAGV
ncbi:hypothetical protein ACTWJ8_03505 [Streptomyces sp. SDT5-1]|uniref:hypothetical protein n=1 Tax=Streptomyces sp. SDT5-1 TaxID=3406418 RepID=UPI003FD631C2